ncbi:MAG: TIGR03619 family F420-dependent LLM class oxidoreductase [Dehalococcoidia bacterium]
MQFGFGIFPYIRFRDVREVVDVVQAGEELGYDVVTLPDHLLPPRWPEADMSTKLWYDLPVLAAYLAASTQRIKFLTSVLVVPYHDPIGLAKALATLDVLSGGRVLCGVGTGWMQAEFRRLHIPFADRGAITDEYLRAMIELWASDAPRFAGRYIAFDDVSFFPRPLQQPHIPLYIGGTGARPFRRVAEIGDGWYPMTATEGDLAWGVTAIRSLMAKRGRDPESLWVGFGLGFGDDEQVRQMRRHAGDDVERAPLRDADEAIAAIRRYQRLGVTFLSVGVPWQNANELLQGLRWFAQEVMPAFR